MKPELLLYILVMAAVTYLIRMLPFNLFRKKITNQFLLSFFHYVPYAVLGAMTIPWVFYSTGSFITAAVATAVAALLAFFKQSLIVVALSGCAAAYICSIVLSYIPALC